ncbi:hypothetical protein BLNAU_21034 [Blattamonas nauphoetae]|uniref:Uncharacterized protein n=1 Tax=Blattamonas nauphoetae TaxID=2049346 RepID=A0ABQ9X162_9EUKA|nr:hypothetical protein BLNAU_21034 [Blattamonas nauphoetae]
MDSSLFLKWSDEQPHSDEELPVIYLSLVAILKLQPALDDSLETKIVKFLDSVVPKYPESADDFLNKLASLSDDSLTDFVQSIVVLLSSPSQAIVKSSMNMLRSLIYYCSAHVRLALVKADLIPQLITTLNPLSLSLIEAVDIHTSLISLITYSVDLATPYYLTRLGIEDGDGHPAVHETIFQQVLVPSEKYICHLCVNRSSIIDTDQSQDFIVLLARLLEIGPYYQPTMNFVGHIPVVLSIPSFLTSHNNDRSIEYFLWILNKVQRECNKRRGHQRQMWKTVQRMLRMEGIEDMIEQKLQNDKHKFFGREIVTNSIEWSNLLGMNLPEQS